MKCQNCGFEFNGAFCPSCGTPAQGAAYQQPPVNQEPAYQQQSPVNQEPAYQQPPVQNTYPEQPYQQYNMQNNFQQPLPPVKCTNCGQDMDPNAKICFKCGAPKGVGKHYCSKCGSEIGENAVVCIKCGEPVKKTRSKLITLIFAILAGGFGLSAFYLGYNKYALIQLIVSVALCWTGVALLGMWVWALVQAILVFMGKCPDADGNQLKD